MDTIVIAYEHSTQETLKLEGVTRQQVRSMAAAWAYFKVTSLTEIRKAVDWKSSSVFAQLYLRDVGSDEALRGPMLPVVAAGQVLTL